MADEQTTETVQETVTQSQTAEKYGLSLTDVSLAPDLTRAVYDQYIVVNKTASELLDKRNTGLDKFRSEVRQSFTEDAKSTATSAQESVAKAMDLEFLFAEAKENLALADSLGEYFTELGEKFSEVFENETAKQYVREHKGQEIVSLDVLKQEQVHLKSILDVYMNLCETMGLQHKVPLKSETNTPDLPNVRGPRNTNASGNTSKGSRESRWPIFFVNDEALPWGTTLGSLATDFLSEGENRVKAKDVREVFKTKYQNGAWKEGLPEGEYLRFNGKEVRWTKAMTQEEANEAFQPEPANDSYQTPAGN